MVEWTSLKQSRLHVLELKMNITVGQPQPREVQSTRQHVQG